jgi:hypothetical protein
MGRSKSDKFIPDSDDQFADMARKFAGAISRDPGRFMLSSDDATKLVTAAKKFRDALALATRPATRTTITRMRKDDARVEAERIVRLYGNLIRVNPAIDRAAKIEIDVKERPTRLKRRTCPQTPPMLMYVGTEREQIAGEGLHVLRFIDEIGSGTRAKPAGAARLELFVGLVWPNDPTPKHPSELSGGPFWYLRSFTKSPMRVRYPLPAEPMRVVYWARWADATGEVGPWSKTCEASVVHSSRASAMRMEDQRANQARPLPVIVERVDDTPLLPDQVAPLRQLPEAA